MYITGLPIIGKPVTEKDVKYFEGAKRLDRDILGSDEKIHVTSISLSWLREKFSEITNESKSQFT